MGWLGYRVWLIGDLKRRRYDIFLQLVTLLDRRCEIIERLSVLVAQQIKSEQLISRQIKDTSIRIRQERKHIHKRLSSEEEFSRQIGLLIKVIQTYISLRGNPGIMQEEILLAEVEERITTDILLFNTVTRQYNRTIGCLEMRLFAPIVRLRLLGCYVLIRGE